MRNRERRGEIRLDDEMPNAFGTLVVSTLRQSAFIEAEWVPEERVVALYEVDDE